MKKTILFLSSIILSGLAFDGCKKGPDDPALSIHTRKGKLTADWAISAGTSTSTSGSTTSSETWTATSVTWVQGSTSTTGNSARYNMSIVKDGTWKLDEGYTVTFGSTSTVTTITANGTWTWLAGVGKDHKNKEQICLRTLSQNQTSGSTVQIDTYTGDDAPAQIWELDELKSKELIVKWTGTSTSGSSMSSDSGTMTFTKKK